MPRKPRLPVEHVKTRDWLFTMFVYKDSTLELTQDMIFDIFGFNGHVNESQVYMANEVQVLVFQHELSPKTGRHHMQGFVRFKTPKSMYPIRTRITPNWGTVHLVPVLSTPNKAFYYCTKEESRVDGPWGASPHYLGGNLIEFRQMLPLIDSFGRDISHECLST